MHKLIAFFLCLVLAAPSWAQETTLNFTPSDTTLSEGHKAQLLKAIIPKLQTTPQTALQVNSYAHSQMQTSPARRLSLARALALREFLIAQDISKERIYLHPLGNTKPITDAQTDFITLEIIKQ